MEEGTRREFLGRSAVLVIGTTSCLCGLGGCATFTKIGNTPPIPEDAYSFEADEQPVGGRPGQSPRSWPSRAAP